MKHRNLFSDFQLSKFEAFLTKKSNYTTDQKLQQFGLIIQATIALFLMITEPSIMIYFKFKSKQKGKLEIKNMLSFKSLTIIYSLGLLFSAIIQGMIMISKNKITYVLHYNVSIVGNVMLFLFAFSHKDARDFFKRKFKNFKEEIKFRFKSKVKNKEEGLAAETERVNDDNPIELIQVNNDEVYVIDLEN